MGEYKFGGVVKREFAKGFKVAEMVKLPNGSSFDRLITVWTSTPVAEGTTVEINGTLSVKQSEYVNRDGETKTGLEWNVNDAIIQVLTPAANNPVAAAQAAWSNEAPF
jgi:hypothetical protein